MLSFMALLPVLTEKAARQATASAGGYIIGAIVALLIMFYLFYSLIKPEKF